MFGGKLFGGGIGGMMQGLHGMAAEHFPGAMGMVDEVASGATEFIPGLSPFLGMMGFPGMSGFGGDGQHGGGFGPDNQSGFGGGGGGIAPPEPAHANKKDKHPLLHGALSLGKSLLHSFLG